MGIYTLMEKKKFTKGYNVTSLQTFNTLWENKQKEIRSTAYSRVHVPQRKLAKDRLFSAELGSAEDEGLSLALSVAWPHPSFGTEISTAAWPEWLSG